nr:serine/threonine-protein kinase ht1 [Quercus suber]
MKERSKGFVREEIERIDEQLQRNLSLRSMQKQKLDDKGMQKQQNLGDKGKQKQQDLGDKGMQKQQNLEDNEKKKVRFTEKQDWEIDPSKLIIKQVIAPGAFGTVHRGIYDGQDVAGLLLHGRFLFGLSLIILILLRLSYLHSRKIVHRDIKTENLLLDKNHTLKIIDFDVACLEASNPNEMTARIGTLGYMAPEVLESKPYDRKCDVYSFGICLWEIYCCDMAPYPNVILSDRSSTVVYQNIIPEIPKCCPSSLAEIMRKCWDANPDNRPEMEEVVIMLKAIDTSKGKGMKTLYGPLGCLLFCR